MVAESEAANQLSPDTLCLYRGAVSAEEIYPLFFTCWAAPPSADENSRLQTLLPAEQCSAENLKEIQASGFILLPRLGTVSPWSSKATDIAHRCGIAALVRVEQGWWYRAGDAARAAAVCDRMRQQVLFADEFAGWQRLFMPSPHAAESEIIALGEDAADAAAVLAAENDKHGLALTAEEVNYLAALYRDLRRDPTLVELMMFAQANSEHCRHKIFNATLQTAAGAALASEDGGGESLMQLIRRTHNANPQGVVTAFNDNAAVIHSAGDSSDFFPDADGVYRNTPHAQGLNIVAKAETHNHPTAISPYPGAATGSGGEIRDEAAVGRGAASRAGFSGYMVSALDDTASAPPPHIATARQIITEAPLGAAAYNNEFGRPALAGFFRSYEAVAAGGVYGFHKPVMLAGGVGDMLPHSAGKKPLPAGALIIQLGGEGFRIGIGGGAASSRSGGADAGLDFASVQRDNAEMQRRAQEVLDTLRRQAESPILSLHDVGAGGLANAVCELVYDARRGACVNLDDVPVGEQGMSAADIWCNESQERYVLAILPAALDAFTAVCRRERCPFAVIGETTEAVEIVACYCGREVVNLPLERVLGKINRPQLTVETIETKSAVAQGGMPQAVLVGDLAEAALAVLRHPTVACKRFLITIGDRTVGGLTAREQMVGPWQTPVADCAAVCQDFDGFSGTAFALGERAPLAATDPAAAARLAICEALLNLFAADVRLADVKLSLNWMANCTDAKSAGALHAAVRAASDFCLALGIGVIVGKDSLSMQMRAAAGEITVQSPAFAAAFAFAPMADTRRILTPQLSVSHNKQESDEKEETLLLRLAFAAAPAGTAPSVAATVAAAAGVFSKGAVAADAAGADVEAAVLKAGLQFLTDCHQRGLILAYHDCSDGGLWATVCEMAFAANCGITIYADTFGEAAPETDGGGGEGWKDKAAAALFSEAPAVVIEVAAAAAAEVLQLAAERSPALSLQTIARPQRQDTFMRVYGGGDLLLKESLADLRRAWESVGSDIAAARDNPVYAAAETERDMDGDGGLFAHIPPTVPPLQSLDAPAVVSRRPRVAILREVGTNGQREMAAAFVAAGFDAVDMTMQDLVEGRQVLDARYAGAALCGGFSYGDVLGAGRGWALGILSNPPLAEQFQTFFARPDSFTLGVCNGCQALAHLQRLMPDADAWCFPDFVQNASRRFEARLSMVEVVESPSVFLRGMEGLMFPLVASHGEGRAVFAAANNTAAAATTLRYVDNSGAVTEAYPYNPNGSAAGATGFCSPDGRVTLMMPHPERTYRSVQLSWQPPQLAGAAYTPWRLLFDNARRFAKSG